MPLQLLFRDQEIRHLCECRSAAEKTLGHQAARRLRARLADLCSAEKISEVLAGSPRISGRGQLVIELSSHHNLVLEPVTSQVPTKSNGEADWDAIECFFVIAVDRSHG
jgi:hypothetical protein